MTILLPLLHSSIYSHNLIMELLLNTKNTLKKLHIVLPSLANTCHCSPYLVKHMPLFSHMSPVLFNSFQQQLFITENIAFKYSNTPLSQWKD